MNPAHKPWTEKEEVLLGTMRDSALAKKLDRTRMAVETKRRKLGIAPFIPRSRFWTKREVSLLGQMTDAALAKKLKCSRKHVLEKRLSLGIAPSSPLNSPHPK
jgi:hypothetical protein